MSARERILTIRLLERLAKCPAYADILGVEVTMKAPGPKPENERGTL